MINIRYIFLAIIYLIAFESFGQVITKDSLQIKILRSRQVDNYSVFQSSQLKVKNNALIKVMIKSKIVVLGMQKVELSAFSLLDTVNKIRYRLGDYKGYAGVIGYPDYQPYIKTRLLDEKGRKLYGTPPYDVNQKDFFPLFKFEKYKNFELPINFCNKKKPQLSIVYFGKPSYKKKFTAELFFTVISDFKNSMFHLYYKDQKISNIEISYRKY